MPSLSDLQSLATSDANAVGINPTIFNWMINQESGFNPSAQNGNATGIAQFMPGTAAQMGVNASDPVSSLQGAANYLKSLLSSSGGNYTTALTKYGTLANVPTSVTNSYNNMLTSNGLTNLGTPATGGTTSSANPTVTQTAGAIAESDSFITKIAVVVLGIVLIGGAIMVYHKG